MLDHDDGHNREPQKHWRCQDESHYIIYNKLKRLNVDIATLQETFRWSGQTEREGLHTLLVGKSSDEPKISFQEHLAEEGGAWLQQLCTSPHSSPKFHWTVTIVNMYTPNVTTKSKAKEQFYENIATTIWNIPSTEQLTLLNYNHVSCPSCLEPIEWIKHGQRPLEF